MVRDLDVVVFGATGDTGVASCDFLFYKGKSLGVRSWAPAARNLKKLERVLAHVVGADENAAPKDGVAPSPAIQADSNDLDSLIAMAQRARVVVACAGPFAKYGENVIRACVEAGTHYVDITGETPWVNKMCKRYGEAARKKGVLLISQAAYDSIPSDLTVALAESALRAAGEEIARAETFHMIKGGGLPTGTLQTVIQGVLQARNAAVSMLTFGLLGGPTKEEIAARKRQKEQLRKRGNSIDRAAEKKREGLVSSSAASKASTDVTRNFLSPLGAYSAQAGGQLSLPHFMTTVNTPIVHATAEALGYPKSFEYRERIPTNFLSLLGTGLALVLAPIALTVVIPTLLLFPESVAALATNWRASDPGGNAARIRASLNDNFSSTGSTNVVAIASSASGAKTARISMHSGYEPGLGYTALSAVAVGTAIVRGEANGDRAKGFQTAVGAFGPEGLRKAQEKAGVKFTVELVNGPSSRL